MPIRDGNHDNARLANTCISDLLHYKSMTQSLIMDPQISNTDNQPFSLLTIDANQNKTSGKQDLLTLRLLEASERKMNLIKRLLIPEYQNSLETGLIEGTTEEGALHGIAAGDRLDDETSAKPLSLPANRVSMKDEQEVLRILSKSSADLRLLGSELSQNIEKKRQALHFFFNSSNADRENTGTVDGSLIIELKSGYYLDSSYSQILKKPDFELVDRLRGILATCGLDLCPSRSMFADERLRDLIFQFNQSLYSSSRNFDTFIERLRSDKHLTKVRGLQEEILNEPENFVNYLNLNEARKPIANYNSIVPAQDKKFTVDDKVSILQEANFPSIFGDLLGWFRNPKQDQSQLDVSIDTLRVLKHEFLSEGELQTNRIIDLEEKRGDIKLLLDKLSNELDEKLKSKDISNLVTVSRTLQQAAEEYLNLNSELDVNLSAVGGRSQIELKFFVTKRTSFGILFGNLLTISNNRSNYDVETLPVETINAMDFIMRIQHTSITELEKSPNRYPELANSSETERRNTLTRAINSITFKIKTTEHSSQTFNLSLIERSFSPALTDLEAIKFKLGESDQIELQAYSRRYRAIPLIHSHIDSCTVGLNLSLSDQLVKFKLKSDVLELELSAKVTRPIILDKMPNSGKSTNIDKVHDYLFRLTHTSHDNKTKMFRVLNYFDLTVLEDLILGTRESATNFYLDPFATSFGCGRRDTLRASLLNLRWMRKLNHQVYLNDHENRKFQALQQVDNMVSRTTENLDLRVVDISQSTVSNAYKLIEQQRRLAEEYVKKYDHELKQLCMQDVMAKSMSSILQEKRNVRMVHEPKLRFINVRTMANAVHRLKPKRSVRRPLLPHRQQGHRKRATNVDIESQINLENQWHRLGSLHNRLQLIVTIQKANNVPCRASRNLRQLNNRPHSPFVPSNLNQSAFSSQIQSLTHPSSSPMPAATFLSPPTTYVELVFQRKQLATSLASGINPSWNETLFVPVDMRRREISMDSAASDLDLCQLSGQLYDESLQLNLYDCNSFVQDSISSISYSEPTTLRLTDQSYSQFGSVESQRKILASKQRIERYLLGSMRIPLATLLTSGRIEGSFALNQPLFLDNYQFEGAADMIVDESRSTTPGQLKARQQTLVTLFIALDPPFFIQRQQLEQRHYALGSIEREDVFHLAGMWEDFMSTNWYRFSANRPQSVLGKQSGSARLGRKLDQRSQFAPRYVRALILHSDMRYRLICRLLTPIRPPETMCAGKSRVHRMARFVALLSPVKSGLLSIRHMAPSVWFNSKQLVNNMVGGPEEKAVLLCNYFLYLGKSAALALGNSIPDGQSIYVLVWIDQGESANLETELPMADLVLSQQIEHRDESGVTPTTRENFLLRLPILMSSRHVQYWDPQTGKSYQLGDQSCLIAVGSIVTPENVYANIQPAPGIEGTNFDIRLRQFWAPLFEPTTATLSDSNLASTSSAHFETRAQNQFGSLQESNYNQSNWRQQQRCIEQLRRTVTKFDVGDHGNDPDCSMYYVTLDSERCKHLESTIERAIKSNLLKWRPNRPTYFNRTLSRMLADRLATFEDRLGDSAGDDSWKAELAHTIKEEVLLAHLSSAHRQIVSWPVNMTYTGLNKILDSLFASGVHDADLTLDFDSIGNQNLTSSTQFLVACHVHPYPARTLSVWLYVGAIVKSGATGMGQDRESLLTSVQ